MLERLRRLLQGHNHKGSVREEPEYIQKASIRVANMACEGCARNIEARVSGLGGVFKVETDLKGKQVEVAFDPGKTGEGEIREVLTNRRYLIK